MLLTVSRCRDRASWWRCSQNIFFSSYFFFLVLSRSLTRRFPTSDWLRAHAASAIEGLKDKDLPWHPKKNEQKDSELDGACGGAEARLANGSSRCPEQSAENGQQQLAAWHQTHLAVKPSLETRELEAGKLVLAILLEAVSLRGLCSGRASTVGISGATTPREIGWSVRSGHKAENWLCSSPFIGRV